MAKTAKTKWYTVSVVPHDFCCEETVKAKRFEIPIGKYSGWSFWYPKTLIKPGNRVFCTMLYTKDTTITLRKDGEAVVVTPAELISNINAVNAFIA